ncbi:hypothetical protein E6C60_3492 [Paenibacillus algicola]|uniref:Transcriptional regulator n=1 Tax=Paenibacillus algicola TaxID=2565926 RepID=A0A4P8XP03_9BACL|nr:YutD family protein [Paenibacillus algicola]QCT04203.1 hypothetical protein E6C60_3492 [Paenibacillus algicola]
MIVIGNKSYELVIDYRSGWNPEVFRDRYSEVLERYDYIVGDWGYNQLRLKGFYRDNHPKATRDSSFSTLSDYINEYCNFGCAYFVLHKSKEIKDPKELRELKETLNQEAVAASSEEEPEEASAPPAKVMAASPREDLSRVTEKPPSRNQEREVKEGTEPQSRSKNGKEPREGRESRGGRPQKPWKDAKPREGKERRDRREARSASKPSRSQNPQN